MGALALHAALAVALGNDLDSMQLRQHTASWDTQCSWMWLCATYVEKGKGKGLE
jgi:hypothetical protein